LFIVASRKTNESVFVCKPFLSVMFSLSSCVRFTSRVISCPRT